MNGFSLRTGLVFNLDGVSVRIERLQPDGQILLQRTDDGQLILSSQSALLNAYAEGKISVMSPNTTGASVPALTTRPLADLPEDVRVELRRRMHYLDWFAEHGGFVFTAEILKPLIAEAAREISDPQPPSPTTFYRWFSRHRAAKDVRALIPRYDKRGSRNSKQDERVLELFATAIEEACKASPAANMDSIHIRLANKLQQENLHRLPEDHLHCPSRRTLYRLFDKLEAYEKITLREGRAAADRRLRISKRGPYVTEILERVEVDHTPLDLFLLDEHTRLPRGRPTLTVAIDYFSKMVIGYYISFGGTSTTAVMSVIRHAILPKQPCETAIPNLGIEHGWPCHGLMVALVLDNGMEFHSKDLESVSLDLGIRLQFCPTRTPRFKGTIERFLKTINYTFAHQIPGTSLARFTERGDYDPTKHALLTMAEFKHAFEKWLLDIYSQKFHRGIGTTPWAKWHEGLQRKSLMLPASLASLQQRIGRVAHRKLRHDGLWMHGLRYANDLLAPVLRAWGEGTTLRVVYDPDDLAEIQVWPPEQDEPLTIPAVHQEYAKGLTLLQHKHLQAIARDNGKNTENIPALMAARQELAASLDTLITSRKQRPRRKAAQIHGITSEHPNRRFIPEQPPEKTPSKPAITPIRSLDTPPQAPYPFFSKQNNPLRDES